MTLNYLYLNTQPGVHSAAALAVRARRAAAVLRGGRGRGGRGRVDGGGRGRGERGGGGGAGGAAAHRAPLQDHAHGGVRPG